MHLCTIGLVLAVLAAFRATTIWAVKEAPKNRVVNAFRQLDLQKGAGCPSARVAYIVSFNRKLQDLTRLNIAPVSEAQCLSICTKEQHLDGIKLQCASASYSARLQRCSVHRNGAKPRGNRQLSNDATSTYFEKICLTGDASRSCRKPFFYRVDNAKLPSAANEIINHQTLTGCLNLCASKSDKCKSVMYLPEDRSCIMNDHSAVESGMQLHREPGRNIIYLENGCAVKNQAKARKIHERNYSGSANKETTSVGFGKMKKVDQLLPALRPTISTKRLNLPKNKGAPVRTGQRGVTEAKGQKGRPTLPVRPAQSQVVVGGARPSSLPNDNAISSSPRNVQFVGDSGIQVGSPVSTGPWTDGMKTAGADAQATFGTNAGANFVGDSGIVRQSHTKAGPGLHSSGSLRGEGAQRGAVLLSNPESAIPSEDSFDKSSVRVNISPVDTNGAKNKATSPYAITLPKERSHFSIAGGGSGQKSEPFLDVSPKASQLPTSADAYSTPISLVWVNRSWASKHGGALRAKNSAPDR
uniref:Apple domain-containing protein n=1 Tax=Trichuris muris TaxID=70415 RepID=A0A5S6QIA3_TRIMR